MRITIEITGEGNAAYEGDAEFGHQELANDINRALRRALRGPSWGNVRDYNGNTVGTITIEGEVKWRK